MAVYSDVRKSIRDLCVQALLEFFPTKAAQDKGIIFSHTSGSEPSTSYVAINIMSLEQKGHAVQSRRHNVDDITMSYQTVYEASVQFTFVGSNAGDMVQEFSQQINNNPILIDLYKRYNIGVMRKSTIRRTPQQRDTKYIEYISQDVVFSYRVVSKQSVDYIESVVLEDQRADKIFAVPEGTPIPPI